MQIYPANTTLKLGFEAVKTAVSNHCRSEMGLEEANAINPFSQPKIIAFELERTGEMMRLLTSSDAIPFDHPHDIREAARRSGIARSVLDAASMYNIKQFCTTCRLLKNFLRAREDIYPNLGKLSHEFYPQKELETEIERVVSEHGSVKDTASDTLRQIRKSLNSRRNELRASIDKIMRRAAKDGYLAETEPTIRNGRLVLSVKAEHKRKFNGFIQDVSATGQTVYMEPTESLHINNDIRELEQQEYRETERILMQLTATIGSHKQMLLDNAAALGRADALIAKARFCLDMDATVPEINEEGLIRLKNARNPVLILKNKQLTSDKREAIVPLNLTLNPPEKGLIITGPNAGGKSVMLKTTGLCQLLMQSGFGIPADEDSTLPVYEGLFLDMGDEQSIDDDLSTFSSRLQWIRETLAKAGKDSLVLVDEAGTGTDPEEGVALYQAFLEAMAERGCRTLATTHHGNLKVFAHNHDAFVNASMEFDQANISPTYVFKKGVPGSSYAFEIGHRIGVPDSLLKRARVLTGSSKARLESLILDMESKTQQAETLRMELAQEKAKTSKIYKEYEQRLASIKTERDKLREKALAEAQKIMLDANAKIEEAVQRVYDSKGDKEIIKEIRRETEDYKENVSKKHGQAEAKRKNKQRTYKDPPKTGDAVKLIDSNATGELLEVKGKNAEVLVNGLRVKTKFNNLLKTDKKKEKKSGYTLLSTPDTNDNLPKAGHRLDIRGFRGEEAVKELTWFLDRAVSARLNSLEIIHGKGDGILRKLVHEALKKRKEVKSFDLAPWEQGGPGCTLVELKKR